MIRKGTICLFLLAMASVGAETVPGTPAIGATDFLNSIGVNSAISVRGEKLPKTIECALPSIC